MRKGLVAFALVLVLGGPAARGDLSPEEERWVRDLVGALGGNSPRVRKGAEVALQQVGVEALPVVVEVWPTLKSDAARKAVLRALEALGREEVVRALGRMREGRSKSENKKVDELLAAFGGGAVAAASSAPFEKVLLEAAELAPLAAKHRIVAKLAVPGLPVPAAAEARGTDLAIDMDGDGAPETLVARGAPKLLRFGLMETPVLVFFERGGWAACPASMGRAKVESTAVEVLDADGDGTLGSAGDFLRVGDGAFGRWATFRRIPFGEGGTAGVQIRREAAGDVLVLSPDPRIPGLDGAQEAGFRALNQARATLGLGAVLPDLDRCAGCKKHAQYLSVNAADPEHQGLGVHKQIQGKPGWTEEGARAATTTVVHHTADAARAVPGFLATMLHRTDLLGSPVGGFGIGSSGGGRGAFTVLWGEDPVVEGAPAPLVVPAPGQRRVPVRGSGEQPAPDAPAGWYDQPRGWPVSVHHAGMDAADVRIGMYLAGSSTPVPGQLWNAAAPIAAGRGGATAFFMPAAPLEPRQAYVVEVLATRAGAPVTWSWTFRTD